MTATVEPAGRVRRSRAVWLTTQLLLGVGVARPAQVVVIGVVACLVALAIAERAVRIQATTFALVVLLVAVAPTAWPLPALVAGAWLLARSRGTTRRPAGPDNDSAPDRSRLRAWLIGIVLGIAASALVSPLVLLSVHTAPMAFPVPQPPLSLICCLILTAAGLNALAEESLWRGAIIATDRALGLRTRSTIAVQAIGFGIAHLHGIPGGAIGVLAAATFGAAMAWLRLRAGLGPTLIAHFLTDVAIFSIVASTAVFAPT